MECQDLKLEIRPWKDLDKIYFDIPPESGDSGKALLEEVRIVPEYKISVMVRKN